ncbi:hypothetical protein QJQ45_004868 [Haematococcus lacustris]|nr:hypothetical protein QJQ45_004868 [Haematococcus lacustris]
MTTGSAGSVAASVGVRSQTSSARYGIVTPAGLSAASQSDAKTPAAAKLHRVSSGTQQAGPTTTFVALKRSSEATRTPDAVGASTCELLAKLSPALVRPLLPGSDGRSSFPAVSSYIRETQSIQHASSLPSPGSPPPNTALAAAISDCGAVGGMFRVTPPHPPTPSPPHSPSSDHLQPLSVGMTQPVHLGPCIYGDEAAVCCLSHASSRIKPSELTLATIHEVQPASAGVEGGEVGLAKGEGQGMRKEQEQEECEGAGQRSSAGAAAELGARPSRLPPPLHLHLDLDQLQSPQPAMDSSPPHELQQPASSIVPPPPRPSSRTTAPSAPADPLSSPAASSSATAGSSASHPAHPSHCLVEQKRVPHPHPSPVPPAPSPSPLARLSQFATRLARKSTNTDQGAIQALPLPSPTHTAATSPTHCSQAMQDGPRGVRSPPTTPPAAPHPRQAALPSSQACQQTASAGSGRSGNGRTRPLPTPSPPLAEEVGAGAAPGVLLPADSGLVTPPARRNSCLGQRGQRCRVWGSSWAPGDELLSEAVAPLRLPAGRQGRDALAKEGGGEGLPPPLAAWRQPHHGLGRDLHAAEGQGQGQGQGQQQGVVTAPLLSHMGVSTDSPQQQLQQQLGMAVGVAVEPWGGEGEGTGAREGRPTHGYEWVAGGDASDFSGLGEDEEGEEEEGEEEGEGGRGVAHGSGSPPSKVRDGKAGGRGPGQLEEDSEQEEEEEEADRVALEWMNQVEPPEEPYPNPRPSTLQSGQAMVGSLPYAADLDRCAHAFSSLTLDRSRYRLLCEAHRTARGLWDALALMATQELLATRGPVLERITHLRMTPEQPVTDYWLHAVQLHTTAN